MDNSSNESFDVGGFIKIIAIVKCVVELILSALLTKTLSQFLTLARYGIGDYSYSPTADCILTFLILCVLIVSFNAFIYGFGELVNTNDKIARMLEANKEKDNNASQPIRPEITTCKYCGANLTANQKFCTNCGRENGLH